jgi:O-antigen ligase
LFAINSIKKNHYYNFFLIIFFFIVVFITGERASFFLFTVGIFYSFLFFREKKIYLYSLIAAFIFLTTIVVNKNSIKERMILQTFNQLYSENNININKTKKLFLFSEGHQILIFSALNIFYQNPFIGVGPNLFRFECENEKYFISGKNYPNFSSGRDLINHCNTHPHNYYVQILSETGIVGFLFIFLVLIKFTHHSIKILYTQVKRNIYISQYKIFISSAVIINLWPFITTGNFFGSSAANLFWLPVGFFLATFNNRKK